MRKKTQTSTFTFKLPPQLHEAAEMDAEKNGQSLSEWIRRAMQARLTARANLHPQGGE